jgi:hypothetical protein
VTFFTAQKGRLSGVAKGARKSRKRFVNALDLFSLVNLEYAPRRQGNLLLLESGKLLDAHPGLRADFSSLSKASYMIELTEILFPPGVSEPGMFELLNLSLTPFQEVKRWTSSPSSLSSRPCPWAGTGSTQAGARNAPDPTRGRGPPSSCGDGRHCLPQVRPAFGPALHPSNPQRESH